ncbi:MAG TPA: BtpA/SgcQ family protein [Planctomycetota bacterium]|nr:BtpA/SgcQ family protein [Planctomycetota bacterium]
MPTPSPARSFPPAARPLFVGVVHLLPTTGAPRSEGSLGRVIARAVEDARALAENGCDAILVENYGDAPFYPEAVPPETVAAVALCASAVIAAVRALPVGVNVLRNDARSALAICAATGASFLRVNVHAGAAATDQGILQGRAHETLRERARLAPGVAILADAHVKHATPLGRESLAQAVRDLAARSLADLVIVSGTGTGVAPSELDLREAREAAAGVPLLIGSGLTPDNAAELLPLADGAIVGTALERDGRTAEPVDPARVAKMKKAFDALRARR